MTNKKAIWVSPNDKGGWRVHKVGAQKDSIHTQTKEEAIKKAREIVKNTELELLILSGYKLIGIGNSYGRDPFPPRI